VIAFIVETRKFHGVEPVYKVLPIAPSTYFDHQAKRDAWLLPEIKRVHKAHFKVSGVQRLRRQLAREDVSVARCTVARRIVGWRRSRTAHKGFLLDALEQALHVRRPLHRGGLVHHSGKGSHYVSIKYTKRLLKAGIEPSASRIGARGDNALVRTIYRHYKPKAIHWRGPWLRFEAVEFATLEWFDWFNNRRLLAPICYFPPAEAEERYYAPRNQQAMAA